MIEDKIIIGSRNCAFRNKLTAAIMKIDAKAELVALDSADSLYHEMQTSKNISLLCDKFFLGVNPKIKMIIIKSFNKNFKFVVCDYQSQQLVFGYRLYKLGIDGFINEIENTEALEAALRDFFSKGKFFPEKMRDDIRMGRHLDYSVYLGDVSNSEFEVALKKISGLSSKEIDKKSINKIDMKFHRFKTKTGIITYGDYSSFIDTIKSGECL